MDSSQIAKQAPQPAACSQPGCKPTADSLQSSGPAGQQLAHSSACQKASGSALTPAISLADSGLAADTSRANSASMATGGQAAHTGFKEEPVSQSSASDAKRPGRRKQSGSPQRRPAKLLDASAAAWQPPEATSTSQPAAGRQPSHCLQGREHLHARQAEQTVPSPAARSSAAVLVNGKAELSDNPPGAHMSAGSRGNGFAETESSNSVAAGSSTADNSQPASPASELERVVQLYLHLTAYSKSRERQLFQEAGPVLKSPQCCDSGDQFQSSQLHHPSH